MRVLTLPDHHDFDHGDYGMQILDPSVISTNG